MRVYHACPIPEEDVPLGVVQIKKRWTCPTCGERWLIIYRSTGYVADRMLRLRFIKHWRWTKSFERKNND